MTSLSVNPPASASPAITDPDDATAQAAVTDLNPTLDAFGLAVRQVPGGKDANATHELLYLMLGELKAIRTALET